MYCSFEGGKYKGLGAEPHLGDSLLATKQIQNIILLGWNVQPRDQQDLRIRKWFLGDVCSKPGKLSTLTWAHGELIN